MIVLMRAEPRSRATACRVDHPEVELLLDDRLLHGRGSRSHTSSGPHGLLSRNTAPGSRRPARRASPRTGTGGIRRSGGLDQVGGADRPGPKRRCDTVTRAGLLRIVDEVALGWIAGSSPRISIAVLVGAHRAVGAEAVEDGAEHLVPFRLEGRVVLEHVAAGDVVDDAHREAVPRAIGRVASRAPPFAMAGVNSLDESP
jgi:hypothetical protein